MTFPFLLIAIVAGLWVTAEVRVYQADLRASSMEMELPGIDRPLDRPAPIWLVLDDGVDRDVVDPT